jgi:hypothetical protein
VEITLKKIINLAGYLAKFPELLLVNILNFFFDLTHPFVLPALVMIQGIPASTYQDKDYQDHLWDGLVY